MALIGAETRRLLGSLSVISERRKRGVEGETVMTATGDQKISIKAAAGVSGLVTLANFFTVFLASYTLIGISGDVGEFLLRLVVFVGGSFAGTLLTILGLSSYLKK